MALLAWSLFVLFILTVLALDLGILSRHRHTIATGEALLRTACCVALALSFSVFLYFGYDAHWLGLGQSVGLTLSGHDAAAQFLTGYLVEQSLSLDNLFVIALIFSYFEVPSDRQHRVLFWGIIGALVMRGVMIAAGAAVIHRFDWVIYVFGAILLYTAFKMLRAGDTHLDLEQSRLVRLTRRLVPVSADFEGDHFFTRLNGQLAVTPLFLALLVVEATDLLFAVDSIPAVFGVTSDPFLVFTSNVFAILGLRSMFFALSDLLTRFRYLKQSLVAVLAFVGVKMIVAHHYPIPALVSLGVVCAILGVGVVFSMLVVSLEKRESAVVPAEEFVPVPVWGGARSLLLVGMGSIALLVGLGMYFL